MAKRRRRANVKKDKKTQKKKSIENTKPWQNASWDYSGLLAQDMMPPLSTPLIGQERIKSLLEILKGCPEFYPALIELGYRYVQEGMDNEGKEYIDKGFHSLKMHFSNKELIDHYYHTCEFLEKYLRFELAIGYYSQLLELERDKAKVHDSICYCYTYLGDSEKAYENQQKTIELNHSNHRYYCNMGWLEMIRGNIDAAKTMLDRSLELDPKDKLTNGNFQVCNVMLKNKRMKDWKSYLLRHVDHEYLEELEKKEDSEEYEKQVQLYNHDKLEAFKFDLVQNTNYTLSKKYDIMFTLNYILDIIEKMNVNDYFFYDDITEVEITFEHIMHRFIITTGDIDEEIFNGAYTALLEFYKFLAKHKVVSGCKELKQEMLKLKPELLEKMFKYNEIRYNDEYTKEEIEELRDEIFDGDVYWPL